MYICMQEVFQLRMYTYILGRLNLIHREGTFHR